MNNEALILERIQEIETQLAPLSKSVKNINELAKNLMPLANQACQQVVHELQDVESSFQLDDLLEMSKQFFRTVRELTFALTQLRNIVDFVKTLEPLLRSTVPQIINYLDDLEQRGVFRMIKVMLDVRAKIAAAYSAEDLEEIGDGVVAMLSLAKSLTDPKAIALLEGFAALPAWMDLANVKKVGPVGLVSACCRKEVKEGLGVLMELTKGLGKLKNGNIAARDDRY